MSNSFARSLLAVALTTALALGFASQSSAASGTLTGRVVSIQLQQTGLGNNWFYVDNTASVGNCLKTGSPARVMVLIPDDERGKAMLGTAQAALLSGRTVDVNVDDLGATSGTYCFAKQMSLK